MRWMLSGVTNKQEAIGIPFIAWGLQRGEANTQQLLLIGNAIWFFSGGSDLVPDHVQLSVFVSRPVAIQENILSTKLPS